MNKQLLKTICLLLFANLALAQKNKPSFYVTLNSGYSLGINKTNEQNTNVNVSATDEFKESNYFSFGGGLNFGGAIGYQINNKVAFEIEVNYLKGNTNESRIRLSTSDIDNSYINSSAKMLQIKPTILFSLGYSKWNPYAKVGMIFGKGSIFRSEQGNFSGGFTRIQLTSDGGWAIGFQAGCGVNYAVAPKIKLFSEINFISLSYSPEKGKYTELFQYGRNRLLEGPNATDIVYVDKTTNDPDAANKPKEELKTNYSFGSVGINFGIRYDFN